MKAVLKGLAVATLAMSVSSLCLASEWEGGDAVKGAKVFKKCQACHTVEEGGPNRVGPNLHNIMDRGIAAKADYNYSAAMKKEAASGAKWDEDTLFKYLENPQAFVPGTIMSFPGLKKEQDRKDLLAYMETATGHKK
ncbi:MAG: cytochrome c family protein [Parvibaculum sp.]|uniref:c-type cytochrome n=1 Tax=Parvibaculum sp. TaxID=2024848 RepID=UPI003C766069